MSKSPLKCCQNDLACYVKRFVKMTKEITYTRREFPDGSETFTYFYSEDPGQNETKIEREDYKSVRGVKEWLLDLDNIEFSEEDINNLRIDVKKIFQIILETSVIKTFHIFGKFSGSEVKGIATFESISTKSKRTHLLRIAKKLELKLKGYTSFTGQFSFNKIVVKSKECWEEDSVTATNYLLNSKKYQLIQALPKNASVGDSGVFMEIKDATDNATLSWRLEIKHGRIFLVIIESVSKVQRNLSYSATDFYELDLQSNFYHYQTRLEFSNGDNILLNSNDIFATPNLS